MISLKPLVFKRNFTWRLLFYSWKDLKRRYLHSQNLNKNNFSKIDPVSLFWFVKTADQIRNGTFIYKESKNSTIRSHYTIKNSLISRVKQRIIENAFVIILEPYFYLDFSFVNLNLKKVFACKIKVKFELFLTT